MEHREWAYRDCRECQEFRFEGGKIRKDKDGNPVRNAQPLDCRKTPCKCDRPWGKPQLTPVMWAIYARYRQCALLGTLPRAGGLDMQNSLEMRFFAVIKQVEQEVDQSQRASMAGKLGPLAMFLMPPSR